MFHKPFRVKSNSSMKSSSRKKLKADILEKFSNLTQPEIDVLIPNKEEMAVIKLHTHSGIIVTVYSVQKNPVVFEVDGHFYPTVYSVWKVPSIVPSFTTWPPVLKKLCGGADLMLPGVVLNPGRYRPSSFGNLGKGDACFVNLTDNGAAVAVGKTAMSSSDMFDSGKLGKGVIILHTYNDHLYALGDKTELPCYPPPFPGMDETKDDNISHDINSSELMPERSDQKDEGGSELIPQENIKENELIDEGNVVKTVDNLNLNDDAVVEEVSPSVSAFGSMDELLLYCFLKAWRTSAKKLELPILASTFYKVHILPGCPHSEFLDIKKTSYKKLSKFLLEMKKIGIIDIKELTKGVESIIAVNLQHPQVAKFRKCEGDSISASAVTSSDDSKDSKAYKPPAIEELYLVTADVIPLFKTAEYRKGDALTAADVRTCLTRYVKDNNLQSLGSKSHVQLDAILADVTLKRGEYLETITWEEMMTRLTGKMKPGYKLVFPGKEPIIKKGKAEPIEISISQRAANKQVTLIHNLELYGIDPHQLAHTLQIGVAASTSVNPSATRKDGLQVLVQGNQVGFLSHLLLDDYKIPRKYIKGLELAPKKGRK